MEIIAHRGNLNGPSEDENKPEQILKAIEAGFDVELDLWILMKDNKKTFWLGHDNPQYKVEYRFLENIKDKIWIHAKNLNCLRTMRHFNMFWHETDKYTMTTKFWIWAYPGQDTNDYTVLVMEDDSLPEGIVHGVCTDYPEKVKEKLLTLKKIKTLKLTKET